MSAYFFLKFAHVVGAAVLLGTGAGIAFFMLMAHRTGDARVVAAVAATAVIAQPVSGYLLMREIGYPPNEGWIVVSLALYVWTGAWWLPVVWMQARMRKLAQAAADAGEPLPAAYHRLYRLWFAFGFPAFAAVLAILWLMIARPHFTLF